MIKKTFFESIIEAGEQQSVITHMRNQKLPLVLWGVGDMASEVYEYLSEEGIKVDAVCVDDGFYEKDMSFNGYRVERLSDIELRYNEYNVIVGHSYYENIDCFKNSHKSIKEVFALCSVSYGAHEITDIEYIRERIEEYERVYNLLEDDLSRNCFIQFLNARISGDYRYVLNAFGKYMNYFNNDLFRVESNEVYIDIGAYDGDSIKLFLKESNGKFGYIYALEPDNSSRNKLIDYINKEKLHDVIVSSNGAWNSKRKLCFDSDSTQESSFIMDESDGESIDVDRVDDMFDYKQPPTLIKINYFYGVEEGIEGCSELLKKYRPKVACTVGFDADRIRTIPNIIHEINSDYKIYLRFNRAMTSALTLYAI